MLLTRGCEGNSSHEVSVIRKGHEGAVNEVQELLALFFSIALYTWCMFDLHICDIKVC